MSDVFYWRYWLRAGNIALLLIERGSITPTGPYQCGNIECRIVTFGIFVFTGGMLRMVSDIIHIWNLERGGGIGHNKIIIYVGFLSRDFGIEYLPTTCGSASLIF